MTAGPDYSTITARQQKAWTLGDDGRIAIRVTWLADSLVHDLDVRAGERVLDVAAGSGNAALAAARRFADVLATDYVPQLLDEAERRAGSEGLPLAIHLADAQALPFDDDSFDVVLSTIGAMFAPDQQRAADELVRVCRTGGRIGMVNWTPDSIMGDLMHAAGRHVPDPPEVPPPAAWGREERVRELFGDRVELTLKRASMPFRYPSVPFWADYFRMWYGPARAAFDALEDDGQGQLYEELLALAHRRNTAGDGTFATDTEYLEVLALKR
jgi:SAM-dependent methyltransferase